VSPHPHDFDHIFGSPPVQQKMAWTVNNTQYSSDSVAARSKVVRMNSGLDLGTGARTRPFGIFRDVAQCLEEQRPVPGSSVFSKVAFAPP
jgi:hypothetical protein